MLRLKTPEHLRIVQADGFEASYGGAESNVAVSLANLGDDAAFLTKLPKNPVGDAAFNELRRYGVDTSRILRGGARLGIYFFEKEAISAPQVSSMTGPEAPAEADADEFNWEALLSGIDIFFFSGVTPAISFRGAGCFGRTEILPQPRHYRHL